MEDTSSTTIAVIAGYFNYPTETLIKALMSLANNDFVILMPRDSDLAPSILNPFCSFDKMFFVKAALGDDYRPHIFWSPLYSRGYDHVADNVHVIWGVTNVLTQIAEANSIEGDLDDFKVTLAGFTEDEISLLQKEELNLTFIDTSLPTREEEYNELFQFLALEPLPDASNIAQLPIKVEDWLTRFRSTESFKKLHEELKNKIHVNETYGTEQTHTADAICLYKDQILLVTRKNHPFAGKLALPGGMVDKGEDFVEAAIREFGEETLASVGGRRLTVEEVAACLKTKESINVEHPYRDPRHGNYIGHAVVFDFSDYELPPEVKGADDALKADWYPKDSLKPRDMAFDHFALLNCAIDLQYDQEPRERNWADILRGRPSP